jgi:flagellar biogenesis protein FliO
LSLSGIYITTAIIVVVIAALGYALKRVLAFTPYGQAMEEVRILAIRGLAPKKSVALVAIRDKIYILGLADQMITLIDTIQGQQPNEGFSAPLPTKNSPRFIWKPHVKSSKEA